MPENRITYAFLEERFELEPTRSRCRIAMQRTLFGDLWRIVGEAASPPIETSVYSGPITIDFHINTWSDSKPIVFGDGRRDASSVRLASPNGQVTFYDGAHHDVDGTLQLFVHRGRFWMRFEGRRRDNDIVADIAVDFAGYEVCLADVDWLRSQLPAHLAVAAVEPGSGFEGWDTRVVRVVPAERGPRRR